MYTVKTQQVDIKRILSSMSSTSGYLYCLAVFGYERIFHIDMLWRHIGLIMSSLPFPEHKLILDTCIYDSY